MVRLREIPRTATFAWSSEAASPWIVTGTKSGAVDIDFSNETCLELWNLSLDDTLKDQELRPTTTITTESGFHDLAWGPPTETYKKGIIAGALDSGTLILWDADKLQSGSSDAQVYNGGFHSGAIKALQFNPRIPNLIATGGSKGELFVTDLTNLGSPIRLGSTAARADDIDCLDWNKKVSNILVTGSSGGFVTVWDVKSKKESLTLNNFGRKPVSAVAWDPENPTRLITTVPLEQEPVILVWDLRNSNAPEKVLRGHDSGVLSVSWCTQDSDLLLSCGKDNRTILWNPQTGQAYGDYPVVTNWTFQTRWNPRNPGMFATASFDGKLSVQTLQNTNAEVVPQHSTQAADGEDFFSRAQTQPQASSFSLPKAPKWLERPASVSFGFGGRLVSIRPTDPGKCRASTISITTFEVESGVGSATDSFQKALTSGELDELCVSRATEASSDEERADWQVMQTLLSKNPRGQLVKYLGFDDSQIHADELVKPTIEDQKQAEAEDVTPQQNGAPKRHRRFESVFATDAEGDFLAQLAATKGTKTNTPFQIFTGDESEADRKITNLIMLGKFDKAFDIALAEDRMSDAFMLAICGGESCIKKAQEAYLAKQGAGPNYLRLLASVVGKNLWDTVHNADLEDWREVMATLCTFGNETEFPDLCEALGDRLEEQGSSSPSARKDAAFCFLAGSKLEKVIAIWIQELQENEEKGVSVAGDGSAFAVHTKALQYLIEKVTIFRKIVNYQDAELSNTGDWKLEKLYSKYLEYADIVAAHGQLSTAQTYLDLLPIQYPEADVARSRIQKATKAPSARAAAATASTASTRQKSLPSAAGGYQPPVNTFTPAAPQVPTPYGVSAPSHAQSTYASPNNFQPSVAAANPYAPPAGYNPPQQMRAAVPPPPAQQFGAPPIGSQVGAPSRMFNSSPAVQPPPKDRNMTNWNDIPEDFMKERPSRRGTPAQTNPYAPVQTNQRPAGQSIPPPSSTPLGFRNKTPLPPPPKVGQMPPPRLTSPTTAGAEIQRPGSTAASAYAPVVSNLTSPPLTAPMPPPIARGPSPYNAPPSTAPPPNRYAPTPGSQGSVAPPSGGRREIAPPPQASQFASATPISNPYAPGRAAAPPLQNQYGAPPSQGVPPPPPPKAAIPPPPQQQHQKQHQPQQTIAQPPPTSEAESKPAPAVRKHPKGDRSHISEFAQPVFTILSEQMSIVEGRAPAAFKPQVNDTRKRLEILFDHLNNEDLLKPDTVGQLVKLSQAMQARNFDRASQIQMEVQVNKVEECGNWMVGVKRLVGMAKATAGGQ